MATCPSDRLSALRQHRYEPVEPAQVVAAPVRATPPPEVPPAGAEGSLLIQRRRQLPDRRLVHGRMFLAAWQAGLDTVADAAVDVVMLAVQVRRWASRPVVVAGRVNESESKSE